MSIIERNKGLLPDAVEIQTIVRLVAVNSMKLLALLTGASQ